MTSPNTHVWHKRPEDDGLKKIPVYFITEEIGSMEAPLGFIDPENGPAFVLWYGSDEDGKGSFAILPSTHQEPVYKTTRLSPEDLKWVPVTIRYIARIILNEWNGKYLKEHPEWLDMNIFN